MHGIKKKKGINGVVDTDTSTLLGVVAFDGNV